MKKYELQLFLQKFGEVKYWLLGSLRLYNRLDLGISIRIVKVLNFPLHKMFPLLHPPQGSVNYPGYLEISLQVSRWFCLTSPTTAYQGFSVAAGFTGFSKKFCNFFRNFLN